MSATRKGNLLWMLYALVIVAIGINLLPEVGGVLFMAFGGFGLFVLSLFFISDANPFDL